MRGSCVYAGVFVCRACYGHGMWIETIWEMLVGSGCGRRQFHVFLLYDSTLLFVLASLFLMLMLPLSFLPLPQSHFLPYSSYLLRILTNTPPFFTARPPHFLLPHLLALASLPAATASSHLSLPYSSPPTPIRIQIGSVTPQRWKRFRPI
ncbi:hypothetical protein BT96DRAFT_454944 [Gymnopus androsaceus JB14]|uniref:Uncharacterized protein n=1 Tax=Gymnopus androsaceus JB14 TaxID=1447944 RepID=A0A6A4GRW7_9AGAR|nr:hypothetical protein BT96DRAFT_454944 [Gymnopus androsaceus JB14]